MIDYRQLFARRVGEIPRSFMPEILKSGKDPSVISFAGGLPNKNLFPVEKIKEASDYVLDTEGDDALQYGGAEGDYKLREWICERYEETRQIKITPEEILITSGAQQALDLLGKLFINRGDTVLMEEPGYLGAIESFSFYGPRIETVPFEKEGLNIEILEQKLDENRVDSPVKLLYTVPNFQNPSGQSYSNENRREVAEALKGKPVLIVQDDPFGEINFDHARYDSFYNLIPEQTIMLGSFSKVIAPSLRIGWISAPLPVMEQLHVAKGAADLHSNLYSQRVLHTYLTRFDFDLHVATIIDAYRLRRDVMIGAIEKYFPAGVEFTRPGGGMFIWCTLPSGLSSMELFEKAREGGVVIIPGNPFYADNRDAGTFRLNFSSLEPDVIKEGIKRLGEVIEKMAG